MAASTREKKPTSPAPTTAGNNQNRMTATTNRSTFKTETRAAQHTEPVAVSEVPSAALFTPEGGTAGTTVATDEPGAAGAALAKCSRLASHAVAEPAVDSIDSCAASLASTMTKPETSATPPTATSIVKKPGLARPNRSKLEKKPLKSYQNNSIPHTTVTSAQPSTPLSVGKSGPTASVSVARSRLSSNATSCRYQHTGQAADVYKNVTTLNYLSNSPPESAGTAPFHAGSLTLNGKVLLVQGGVTESCTGVANSNARVAKSSTSVSKSSTVNVSKQKSCTIAAPLGSKRTVDSTAIRPATRKISRINETLNFTKENTLTRNKNSITIENNSAAKCGAALNKSLDPPESSMSQQTTSKNRKTYYYGFDMTANQAEGSMSKGLY